MRTAGAFALAAGCAILFASCSASKRLYSTWESLGKVSDITRPVEAGTIPPLSAQPWAGTVSHHLLAYAQIDHWFQVLSKRREVKRFYILSPSHWGLSTQPYSVTDGSWRIHNGFVESDAREARSIARKLGVPLEPRVFEPEHGVSTLIPFIAKYFPHAKVVAIAYQGEPPLNQPMAERLYSALSPAFGKKGKESNFLLVSTDFSHHGDAEDTRLKDSRSEEFFRNPSFNTWITAGCDNRPGIYVLSRLLTPETRACVLYHCDSFKLTGAGEEDITSYFFSYFW